MIRNFIVGKTAAFIDASNIYHSQQKLNWQIDFKHLMDYLSSETNIWKAFYYTAYDPIYKKQKKFLDFLEIVGYVVVTKKVKFIKGKTGNFIPKGNLDVELTMDAVHNKNYYDTFLLFSGDSDFEALIKYLKRNNKRCLVFSTKSHISIELINEAKFIDLKKLSGFIKR